MGVPRSCPSGKAHGRSGSQGILTGAFLWCDALLRGFYVLLLFDIVLCIQVENLTAITASEQTMAAYLPAKLLLLGGLSDGGKHRGPKCLNLVPDLAA